MQYFCSDCAQRVMSVLHRRSMYNVEEMFWHWSYFYIHVLYWMLNKYSFNIISKTTISVMIVYGHLTIATSFS